jgi:hypothetical protein
MKKRKAFNNPLWKNLKEEEDDLINIYDCVSCWKPILHGEHILFSNNRRYHTLCLYKDLKRRLDEKINVNKKELIAIDKMKKMKVKRDKKIQQMLETKEIFQKRYPEMILEEL